MKIQFHSISFDHFELIRINHTKNIMSLHVIKEMIVIVIIIVVIINLHMSYYEIHEIQFHSISFNHFELIRIDHMKNIMFFHVIKMFIVIIVIIAIIVNMHISCYEINYFVDEMSLRIR